MIRQLLPMNQSTPFQTYKSLNEVSTFGIGGQARYYVEARTVEDLQNSIKKAKNCKIPFLIIGKGSNSLFDDRGFEGLLILNRVDFLKTPTPGTFQVGAGYSFALLGVQTARKGWGGLEFASGIPASIGGAVFMNAGANGGETCQTLTEVEYVDPQGELHRLKKEDLKFDYRTSNFQTLPGAIAAATFTLYPNAEARQKQLDIVHYRQKTQPYGDKSAGCVFRNPACNFAGKLIEEAGLKGKQIGGAKVSEMHANFIVNTGNATAKQVLELIDYIKLKVHEKSGIELESEIRLIPYTVEVVK